mmetsp:Transcript_732/g.1229  ORF Transcript_732/g.1229 Transcript_732/m.1229 type:complete len:127 (-) Transcript_732:263-643(-)
MGSALTCCISKDKTADGPSQMVSSTNGQPEPEPEKPSSQAGDTQPKKKAGSKADAASIAAKGNTEEKRFDKYLKKESTWKEYLEDHKRNWKEESIKAEWDKLPLARGGGGNKNPKSGAKSKAKAKA